MASVNGWWKTILTVWGNLALQEMTDASKNIYIQKKENARKVENSKYINYNLNNLKNAIITILDKYFIPYFS